MPIVANGDQIQFNFRGKTIVEYYFHVFAHGWNNDSSNTYVCQQKSPKRKTLLS